MLGLDPQRLDDQLRTLERWVGEQSQADIDRMAGNFSALQVCEQDIVQFKGSDAKNAGIVIDALPSMQPFGEAAKRVHRAANKQRAEPSAIALHFQNRDNDDDEFGFEWPAGYARWSRSFDHSENVRWIIHAACPQLTPPPPATTAPGQTPRLLLNPGDERAILSAHAESYELARKVHLKELALSPLFAQAPYPTEDIARLTIQGALEEMKHPKFELQELQPTSGRPDGADRDFAALAHMWHAAEQVLRDRKSAGVTMTQRQPNSRWTLQHATARSVSPTALEITTPDGLEQTSLEQSQKKRITCRPFSKMTWGSLEKSETDESSASTPTKMSFEAELKQIRDVMGEGAEQRFGTGKPYFIEIVKVKFDGKLPPKWRWSLNAMCAVARYAQPRGSEQLFLHSPMTNADRRIELELELDPNRPKDKEESSQERFQRGMGLWGDLEAKRGLDSVQKTAWGAMHLAKITGLGLAKARDLWEVHHHDPAEVQAIRDELEKRCADAGMDPTDRYREAYKENRKRNPPWNDVALRVFAGGTMSYSYAASIRSALNRDKRTKLIAADSAPAPGKPSLPLRADASLKRKRSAMGDGDLDENDSDRRVEGNSRSHQVRHKERSNLSPEEVERQRKEIRELVDNPDNKKRGPYFKLILDTSRSLGKNWDVVPMANEADISSSRANQEKFMYDPPSPRTLHIRQHLFETKTSENESRDQMFVRGLDIQELEAKDGRPAVPSNEMSTRRLCKAVEIDVDRGGSLKGNSQRDPSTLEVIRTATKAAVGMQFDTWLPERQYVKSFMKNEIEGLGWDPLDIRAAYNLTSQQASNAKKKARDELANRGT
jgi:hypothetical protein